MVGSIFLFFNMACKTFRERVKLVFKHKNSDEIHQLHAELLDKIKSNSILPCPDVLQNQVDFCVI